MPQIAPLVISLFWSILHPIVPLERGALAAQRPSESGDSRALIKITQELLDDIAVGDRSRWSKYLADDCVITGDDGRTLTKQQFLTELQPLPKGYSGKIELDKPLVRSGDGVVVITYDLHEQENVFGQSLSVEYHTTDTWLLRGREWQLIASQSLRNSADPPPGLSDPTRYADYIGIYELAASVTYTVSEEGGKLFGQRTGRNKEELLPETPDAFFRKGIPGRRIFVRDAKGRVVKMADRHEGRDLVWTKRLLENH